MKNTLFFLSDFMSPLLTQSRQMKRMAFARSAKQHRVILVSRHQNALYDIVSNWMMDQSSE
jgi:hypothetical protein